MNRSTLLIGAGILLLCSMAVAAVPHLMGFQGVLQDVNGQPVADGTYSVKFEIYDAVGPGGGCLWEENQSVTTVGGVFSVVLGSSSQGIPDSAFSDSARWLAISVGIDPEMSPRQRLVSVGYSYRVNSVDGATGGVIYGDVSIQSDLSVDGGIIAKGMVMGVVTPGPPEVTPLALKAAPGQSANLVEVRDEQDRVRMAVNKDGTMETYDYPGGYAGRFEGIDGQSQNVEFSLDSAGGIHAAGASSFGDKVSIGTASSSSMLCVGGAIATPVTFVNCTPITLDETHSVVLSAGTPGGCAVNLPSAVGITGRQYTIKEIGNLQLGQTTVVPFLNQTIDGSPIYVLNTPNQYVTIVSDGANWLIIGNN